MGIGRLMDIAVRTMGTYQRAIDIASNNVSNAGSKDYTRQKVVLASEVNQGGEGAGVKIQDVLRVRNDILDAQIRKYQSSLSDAEKRSEVMQQIESIIAEPSENGLSTYFNEFFNSWNELTANPNSTQLRLNVVQKGLRLSERYKETVDALSEIQYAIQREANVKVEQINGTLKTINDLNQKIYESEVRGEKASDLKDQRDSLIDDLSKDVNISVQKNSYGAVLVNVGGIYGADQTSYNEFTVSIVNDQMRLVAKNDSASTAVVNGGEFYAIADMYSNKIQDYKASYDKLASTFVDKVNELHMNGFSMVTGGVSSTGIPFFGELDGNGEIINAFADGSMNVNASLLTNPKLLAASSAQGNDGNGTVANQIATLANQKITELNDQTFMQSYTTVLNSIGLDKVIADNFIESGSMVMQNLTGQKMSTSGVSLDEEMTNIMKYQRSYQASSRLIKVADELLQTILNMV